MRCGDWSFSLVVSNTVWGVTGSTIDRNDVLRGVTVSMEIVFDEVEPILRNRSLLTSLSRLSTRLFLGGFVGCNGTNG